MSSIITLPKPPAVGQNVFATLTPYDGQTVSADTTDYYSGSDANLFYSYEVDSFTNNGVLWCIGTGYDVYGPGLAAVGVLSGYYLYDVTNNGTCVAETSNGNAYGISIGSGGDTVTNAGNLFAVTSVGNANTIFDATPDAVITNSGIVAAQAVAAGAAGVGDAVAVYDWNGATITNQAGGSILAEGVTARGILVGIHASITNHGLIEAHTLDGTEQSVAIEVGYYTSEVTTVVNDGTIEGDQAIYIYPVYDVPELNGGVSVQNLTGGMIKGAIDLGSGADHVINAGRIDGQISTGGGDDVVDTSAGKLAGSVTLGSGNDSFFGSAKGDTASGGSGNDTLLGGGGSDTLNGGSGHDLLDGGTGKDLMSGGSGNDTYVVNNAGDRIVESANAGVDLVETKISWTLGANLEKLTLIGHRTIDGSGNELANTLTGNDHANHLSGLGGDDTLIGGSGADTLTGGNGQDSLEGDAGADHFVFASGDTANSKSHADLIVDFSHAQGDKIDLHLIDAVAGGSDSKFKWIGDAAFSGHAGELHEVHSGGDTYVSGDTDGDGHGDFMIKLTGHLDLVKGDFVL